MTIGEKKVVFARHLRREQTDTEKKMWTLLRSRQFNGLKFRRQQPIGPYIVDFFCARAGMIIELDGGEHAKKIEYDQRRTDFLEKQGYFVLRFWDNEVLLNPDGVLSMIENYLKPSPPPSPQKGEGDIGRRPNI